MYWNRFRYWLGGRSPWGYFGRLSGPETSPDYLVYAHRDTTTSSGGKWFICRTAGGLPSGHTGWVEIATARTLKEAKRLCENDFIGRYNHG